MRGRQREVLIPVLRRRQEASWHRCKAMTELGVLQSFVSKYESGERRLDVTELGHITAALEVSVKAVRVLGGPRTTWESVAAPRDR